jgi:hypothetical protein
LAQRQGKTGDNYRVGAALLMTDPNGEASRAKRMCYLNFSFQSHLFNQCCRVRWA